MKLTQTLKLRKPSPEDYYNIGDQNANMDILETILAQISDELSNTSETAQKGVVVYGSFVGNGQVNRLINLGFTPSVVMLWSDRGVQFYYGNNSASHYGGVATLSGRVNSFWIGDGGFYVTNVDRIFSNSAFSSDLGTGVMIYVAWK